MYELKKFTQLAKSRSCDNGYRAGLIGENNIYNNILKEGNRNRYMLHLKNGSFYYIGRYSKTINGITIACIDEPAMVSPKERLLCIKQTRIFPDGTTKNRSKGILKTLISGISNPDGVFNTLIQEEDWF